MFFGSIPKFLQSLQVYFFPFRWKVAFMLHFPISYRGSEINMSSCANCVCQFAEYRQTSASKFPPPHPILRIVVTSARSDVRSDYRLISNRIVLNCMSRIYYSTVDTERNECMYMHGLQCRVQCFWQTLVQVYTF